MVNRVKQIHQIGNWAKVLIKILIIMIPVAWGLFVVMKYGVNVTYMDELSFMANKQKFLTMDYLWAQHNEHRMFFPKLVAFIVGSIFAWNSKAFMLVSQLFLLLIYFILIRSMLAGRKIRSINLLDTLQILALGLSVYSAAQQENLLWGFQTAWFMIVSVGSISYYVFDKYIHTGKKRYLAYSMLCAFITSFSSLHGLAVWGGYLVILFLRFIHHEQLSIKATCVVSVTCLITIILYFHGWSRVHGHEGYAADDPNQAAAYFLRQVGASTLPPENIICCLIAFIMVVTFGLWFITCVWKKTLIQNIRLIGPMILGLGAMFFISMGRSNGGTGQFVASRYITNSMIFQAFYLATCIVNLRNKSDQSLFYASEHVMFNNAKEQDLSDVFAKSLIHIGGYMLVSISLLLVFRNLGMINTMRESYTDRMKAKSVLVNYECVDAEDLKILHPMSRGDEDGWRSVFGMMKKEKINAFAEDVSGILYTGQDVSTVLHGLEKASDDFEYCIDEVNGAPMSEHMLLPDRGLIKTHGWLHIGNIDNKECYYRIEDRCYRMNWADRPDVKQYYQSSDYYGFEGFFVLDDAETETTSLSFIVINRDKGTYIEKNVSESVVVYSVDMNIQEGIYRFISATNEELTIAVQDGYEGDGGNVHASTAEAKANYDLFEIVEDHGLAYEIRNVTTGKAWDIQGISTEAGANLQQYTFQATDNQLWHFIKTEDGSFRIISLLGTVVTVDSADHNVLMGLYDPDDQQQEWLLRPAEP